MKNIAICLRGQPRTWEHGYKTIIKLKQQLENGGNRVDIFCHIWDFNSFNIKGQISNVESVNVTDLISKLKPASYEVETHEKSIEIVKSTRDNSILYYKNLIDQVSINKATYLSHFSSQYYSMYKSSNLMHEYALKNNIIYDNCIGLRYDMWLSDTVINDIINHVNINNDPYSIGVVHYRKHPKYIKEIFSDIFFIGSMESFLVVCNFYKIMHKINPLSFKEDAPPPEHILSEFINFYVPLIIIPFYCDFKILRSADYINNRKYRTNLDINLGLEIMIDENNT
jgi:hypothetical protein